MAFGTTTPPIWRRCYANWRDRLHRQTGPERGQVPRHPHPKAAEFCRAARRVFDRDTIVSLSYASRQPDQGLEPVHELARELDAVVEWSAVLHRYLLVSPN